MADQGNRLYQQARRVWLRGIFLGVSLILAYATLLGFEAAQRFHDESTVGIGREAAVLGNLVLYTLGDDLDAQVKAGKLASLATKMRAQLSVLSSLRFLALVEPSTDGIAIATLPSAEAPSRDVLLSPAWSQSGTYAQAGYLDVVLPASTQGPPVWLHVGIADVWPDPLTRGIALDFAAGLLAILLMLVLLYRLAYQTQLLRPLRISLRVMNRGCRGDWRHAPDDGSFDELGRLSATLRAIVAKMNGRWRHLRWLGEETVTAVPEQRARIAMILDEIGQRTRFVAGESATLPLLQTHAHRTPATDCDA